MRGWNRKSSPGSGFRPVRGWGTYSKKPFGHSGSVDARNFWICWDMNLLDTNMGFWTPTAQQLAWTETTLLRRAGIHFLQGYLDLRTRWLAKKKVMSHLEKVKHMDNHWPLNKIKGIQYDISNQPQREIAWFFYQFTSPLAPPPIAHLLLESRLHTHTGIAKPLVENLQQSEWI